MRVSPARLLRRVTALVRPAGVPRVTTPGTAAGLVVDYDPHDDDKPDPGEVVWAWVPYEEDASRGKDRPVLVVGRDGPELIALMLTSSDHDVRARADAARGEHWMDVGSGGWDERRRPSEVRLDRVLRLEAGAVRREGAALERARFDEVVAAARELNGWAPDPGSGGA